MQSFRRVNAMDKSEVRRLVEKEVLQAFAKQTGRRIVPAASSNRHIHLCRKDVEQLFGEQYKLNPVRALSQPGQFACSEMLTVCGPKGKIEKVRVLGPERPDTQIEISVTDSFRLGIKAVVRMSGDLTGTPGARLIGPQGSVELEQGVIVSARHLHLSAEQAAAYALKDGETVRLRYGGERSTLFENVVVRAGDGHEMEVHLDTDEANATMLKNGDYMEIDG